VESMVRDDAQRRLLFDLDMSILTLRQTDGDTPPVVKLTGCYHNLLRMWADT
jgi:PKHD-type hydroxylase